jgi:hypothetical protein
LEKKNRPKNDNKKRRKSMKPGQSEKKLDNKGRDIKSTGPPTNK